MNFIEALLLPPGIIVLMGLIAAITMRYSRRISVLLIVASILLLYLFSTPLVSKTLLAAMDRYPVLVKGNIAGEVIVVLGGGVRQQAPEYQRDALNVSSLERLRYGVELQQNTGLPLLLTGGVVGTASSAESDLMQDNLRRLFKTEAQWLERKSRNTEENARYSSEILRQHGVKTIILVTHFWHMPRALRSFEKYGLIVTPAPMGGEAGQLGLISMITPSIGSLKHSSIVIREILGGLWYQLRY